MGWGGGCVVVVAISARSLAHLPDPLMIPVTVPRALLFPLMLGWEARSAATALVIILLGPPTRRPIKPSRGRRTPTGRVSELVAKTYKQGTKTVMKVPITQARRPP